MKKDEKEGMFIFLITIISFGWLMASKPFEYKGRIQVYEDEYDYVLKNEIPDYWVEGITATKYNPVEEQCDEDPLVTADGSKINLKKLERGDLRWVAISRDLLKLGYNYGDTIVIVSDNELDGKEFVVRDTMNPKWRNKIDILSPIGDSLGKWENLSIYKKN